MLKVNIGEKTFGRKIVLKNFQYDFQGVGLYILQGPSGCGKTTLLRLVSGLDKDFVGNIEGGGFSNCSVHFQEYRLFDELTALENITEVSFRDSSAENLARARDLLFRLGFSEDEMKLYPKELSGGMKQRISFARAILRNSNVLLLDEPTKELDPSLVKDMCAIIREEAKIRTVILITHIDHADEFSDFTKINLQNLS